MGEVGGSRHYGGPGLGAVAGWVCPACGAENSGPLGTCAQCGSGQGARRAEPVVMTVPPADHEDMEQGDVADAWVLQHPTANAADAYRAGFLDGVRAARAAAPPPAPSLPETFTSAGKLDRTLIAALELFRDQVLVGRPEEVVSGEWMSADEVNKFLVHLRQGAIDHAHA